MTRLLRRPGVLAIAAVIAACSGGGEPAVPTPPLPTLVPNNGPTLQVGPYAASFKEFPLPPGQSSPADITVGPDGAVWSAVNNGIDRIVGGGTITGFPPPAGVDLVFGGIASARGALWYGVDGFFPNDPEPEQWFVTQPVTGTPSLASGLPPDASLLHIRAAPDHSRVWAGVTIEGIFGSIESSSGDRIDLPVNYFPNDIGFGPDGAVYATVNVTPGSPNSVVVKIAGDAIVKQFDLPDNSNPAGIALGPDGAFWIALPGSNSIGRLTTAGFFTQFPLPTPNSVPVEIIKAGDGALWFTEQNGNRIGRITTNGSISEFTVPTPNAKPYGLTACPLQCDNAHERIWFTELSAGKVAEFVY